jgi:hypothetical protein
MNVNRRLLDTAFLVPPWSIRWLSLDEERFVNLDNMTPRPTAWTLGTNAEGLVFATASVERPGPRSSVSMFLYSRSGQPMAYVNFRPGDLNQAKALYALRTDGPVRLAVDGVVIGEGASSDWIAREYPFISIEVPLLATSFDTLSIGSLLEFNAFVANAYHDYNSSATFPLAGLSQQLPALITAQKNDAARVSQPVPSPEQPESSRFGEVLKQSAGWPTILTATWTRWSSAVLEAIGALVTAVAFGLPLWGIFWLARGVWRFSTKTRPPHRQQATSRVASPYASGSRSRTPSPCTEKESNETIEGVQPRTFPADQRMP